MTNDQLYQWYVGHVEPNDGSNGPNNFGDRFNAWAGRIAQATGANSFETIPDDVFTNPQYQSVIAQASAPQTGGAQTGAPAAGGVDLSQFAGQFPPQVLQAASAIFAAKPDQAQAFQQQYGGNFANWLNAFTGFWSDHGDTAAGHLDQYQPEVGLLNALGYDINPVYTGGQPPGSTTGGTGTTGPGGTPNAGALDPNGQPIEQAILGQITPGLLNQIVGDTGRQTQVGQLTNQTNTAYQNLQNTLGLSNITVNPTTGAFTSPLLTAQNLNADQTTGALSAAAQAAATAQLTALQASIADMQHNLQGALAQQASALQAAVASYNANLSTLDASQRQNLAAQIASMQSNLETSIGAQQSALETELQSLQGNASTAAQSRKAALETQLTSLREAQKPMADARIKGAEALATAVNLGLQSTQDQLRAQAASNGYIGGSTMQDTALARAAIGARQQAAGALAQANIANAGDIRDVNTMGANKTFSIEDALAGDTQRIGDQGAVGRNQLANALATGRQSIGDYGAAQTRGIGDNTANQSRAIGDYAASTGYTNANTGIGQNLALQNAQSQGGYNIATALAQQQQAAANQNAMMRSGYFDQTYPNALNSAQAQAALPGAQAQSLANLIPYGNAGTRDALGLLSWWSNPATAPTQTATTTTPSSTGNQLGQLGAGLIGAGFQYGNANSWWHPTAPTNPGFSPTGQNLPSD